MSYNVLVWVDIPVEDLERAIAFYAAVLDAKIEKQAMGNGHFAVLPHAGEKVSGCLVPSDMAESKPTLEGSLIYLSVNGRIDAAAEAVLNNGGKIITEKHQIGPYGFRVVFVDTEGNRVALHSETA